MNCVLSNSTKNSEVAKFTLASIAAGKYTTMTNNNPRNNGIDILPNNLNLSAENGKYKLNGAVVLSSNTLGPGIKASSLTSLGPLTELNCNDTTTSDTINLSKETGKQ